MSDTDVIAEREHWRAALYRTHLETMPADACTAEQIDQACQEASDEHFALDACRCLACGRALERFPDPRQAGVMSQPGMWWKYRCPPPEGCGATHSRPEVDTAQARDLLVAAMPDPQGDEV